MTKRDYERRAEFTAILADEFNQVEGMAGVEKRNAAKRAAELLMRHGTTYARIQVEVCNGVEWSQYDTNETFNKRQARHERWTEKRDAQLSKRITEIVTGLGVGFGVILGGDPRGCTVKITVPSGKTNDLGREGICVPTA